MMKRKEQSTDGTEVAYTWTWEEDGSCNRASHVKKILLDLWAFTMSGSTLLSLPLPHRMKHMDVLFI